MLQTIIICTRNRADELTRSLSQVAVQAKNFSDVEVIVVDNGSTDNTKEIVEKTINETGFPIRYVFEPIAGLCQARNRGGTEATGKILSYIDDDVQLENGWIEGIRQHFLLEKSDCLGGKVSVRLEGKTPFEIEDEMMWFFCASNFGDKERELKFPEHPIGCNMSVKKEVFEAVGKFNTEIKLYGDETDFFRRVNEKNFTVLYEPEIEISQIIPAERLTAEELKHKSYIWGEGAAKVWLLSMGGGHSQRLKKIAEFGLRTLYIRMASISGASFGKFYTLWYNRGFLAQLIKGLEKS